MKKVIPFITFILFSASILTSCFGGSEKPEPVTIDPTEIDFEVINEQMVALVATDEKYEDISEFSLEVLGPDEDNPDKIVVKAMGWLEPWRTSYDEAFEMATEIARDINDFAREQNADISASSKDSLGGLYDYVALGATLRSPKADRYKNDTSVTIIVDEGSDPEAIKKQW